MNGENGIDDIDGLLSMTELAESDHGTYTVKYLHGTECLYKMKTNNCVNLMQTMAAYRKEGRYCDVVFRIKDELIPAHKVILASASSYFSAMFGQPYHVEAKTNQPIDLSNTIPCPLILNMIFDFLYLSQVQLNEKVVIPLLVVSTPLLLDELITVCVAYLNSQLHPSNCVGIFLCGKRHNCNPLILAAQDYIYDHFEDVVRHEEFLSLSFDELQTLIEDDKVKVECESIIYTAVMQWVRHNPTNRRPLLGKILPCVRLQLLGPAFVNKLLDEEEFAQDDMGPCRQYLSKIQDDFKAHRYCCSLKRRAPIKPLVIYCAGGYHNRSINAFECFFLSTGEWKTCAELKTPRSGVGVVSLFMRIYVLGGRQNTRNENKDCHDVERYDPFLNRWSTLPPMIHARNRLGVGAIDCSIYAVGGSSGQKIHASVERYTTLPDAEAWVEVSPMRVPRIGLATCTLNRLLYAIGGFDGHRRLADVESYDPDGNVWKNEEPLRIGRSGAAAAAIDQFIYVVGGYASDNVEGAMQLSTVERFDSIVQQWSFVKSMSCPRSALSCVTLDNYLFALGGYDGKNFSSVVEIYDPQKNEWTYGTPLTRERSGHGCTLTIEPSLDNDD